MSLVILLSCLAFLQSTESCKTHCQDANKDRVQVTGRTQDCQVPCIENSHCSQACSLGLEGNIGFLCRNKEWRKSTDSCRTLNVLTIFEDPQKVIPNIFAATPSKIGKHETITDVLMQRCPEDLSCILKGIQRSPQMPGNIEVIVELLRNISRVLSEDVDVVKIQSYSIIANHILDSRSISYWAFVPERSSSSILLQSMVSFMRNLFLRERSLDISEEFIHILGISISKDSPQESLSFSMKVNETENEVSGIVLLPQEELQQLPSPSQAISIAFPTLGAILEASFFENVTVNGLILSVILPKELQRISLVFEKITKSRGRTQCVGWHPTENKWDEEACEMALDSTDQTLCSCQSSKKFTSFSILMSPHVPESPVLLYIMYIGLGISMGSLILCLIAEAMVWRQVTKTEISYLRHICIVNIAATLLMADVGFVVASFFSNLVRYHNGCVAVTFFIHFFYLSVFFWMLMMALLILYGIVIVFHTVPKSTVMISAFSVGYGCPLIIAVITVAVTEPGRGYVRPMICWLNWDNTKALLAFVVPALAIVVVNLITVGIVIAKTRRPSIGSPIAQEMAAIVRISKNVAILTPLLGLTWGFGIAIVIEKNSLAFHIIFSLLNAFQGFFILVFGTFLDQKIRDALKVRMSSVKWLSRLSEHISFESSHHPTKGSH
ncbi:adhesion G-protein coupled receptor F2 [Trichosurus vulpecula]|uniref:adhesion G-protein coupled receptor F2 n=1 Tax=Trichosurus vulpecula TaxID=9337 RepID=UPI00186AFCDD|nr:adhesion G-protein coupled receptor F2 [Trichosurus vulpecula]